MIPEEENIEDIFHYTKRKIALEKILPEKRLLLSQFESTNDPREFKEWEIPKPRNNENETLFNEVVIKTINDVMKKEWKVLCFTLENSVPDYIKDPFQRLERELYHGYARPRMWAQYAEKHQGICLWIDGNKLNENMNKKRSENFQVFKGKVNYNIFAPSAFIISPSTTTFFEDNNNANILNSARKYVFDNYKYFFLRKHLDWEAEAEYRWLVHSEKLESEFISIEGAIKGVLISIDFPEEELPLLIQLCKNLHISLRKVNWRNGQPVTEFENVYDPTV